MIDVYKQVLVGQYNIAEAQETAEGLGESLIGNKEAGDSPAGRGSEPSEEGSRPEESDSTPDAKINPSALEYGTKQACITEYYLTDEKGMRTTAVLKGSSFTLHMRVEFGEHIPAPIFAFSVKNARGTEITGTNTMIEKAFLEGVEAGQTKEVTFTQKMSLQGGEYLLSLGVTGYNGDTFEVYHRLYDVMSVTVISDKDTVGYYDMDSAVEVR